ncbi:hypothetical protein ES702_04573 [subsurface metagenome]
MKHLCITLPLALILCFVVGCQDKEAMAELEAMKAQSEVVAKNKEAVRYMLEETDKMNYSAWDEVCSPDYVGRFAGMPESMTLEEHKNANRLFFDAFPDFKHEINDIVAEPDRAIFYVTPTGTHKGEFMGIPPTGKEIEYTALVWVRFSEGKIVEAYGISDMLSLMQQLGMELKPKVGER